MSEEMAQTTVAQPTPTPSTTPTSNQLETWVWLALLLTLCVGGYFRFVGLNWDEYTHLHPDERFLTIVTNKLEIVGDPFLYLRTSESPLNPYNKGEGFYVYGNFPMTVTRYVAELAEWGRGSFCPADSDSTFCRNMLTGYDGVHLVGRALSALMDLWTVWLTFYIGRRLYGDAAGLLAAFFMATAVMSIQQSHFYTMDNWASALATFTFYIAVRASEEGHKKRWWLLFGLGLGLTIASRVNVAPIAGLAAVAAGVWLSRSYLAYAQHHSKFSKVTWANLWKFILTERGSQQTQMAVQGVLMAALLSLVVFRLAQPYAFADTTIYTNAYLTEFGEEPGSFSTFLGSIVGFNPQWQANMEEIQRLQAPEAVFPPALQWVDRAPILFPLTNMLLYGMGLVAGTLAWLGFCWATWRIVCGKPDWLVHALPVSWVAVYFLFMATRWVKSIRYFLPIYPILFLLAGWLLYELWQRGRGQTWQRWAIGGLTGVAVVSNFLWANAFVEIYRQPMTRVAASMWMFENVPTAVTLMYEAEGEIREYQLPFMGSDFYPGNPPLTVQFTLPENGTLRSVRYNYAHALDASGLPATIKTRISSLNSEQTLGENELSVPLSASKTPLLADVGVVPLTAETTYQLHIGTAEDTAPFRLNTSIISSEHWDDALPTRVAGRDPFSQYFRGISAGQMSTTHPDSDQKRQELISWLNETDYIAISSQRSLWSLPRLPLTYPLMVRYYEALFNGELGFEKVAEFHGDIRIGPLYISDTTGQMGWGQLPNVGWPPPGDLAVEEAFSVYDHPPVWIFRKTPSYNQAQVERIFGEVDLAVTQFMNPLEATNAPNAMMLTPEQAQNQRTNGTFSEIFAVDGLLSNNSFVATVVWWFTVLVLGWLTFPIAFVIFRPLPDRGYALSRILSLLLISYFTWLMASLELLPHNRTTLLMSLALVVLVSGSLLTVYGAELRQFVRQNYQVLLILELVGLALFALQLLIRLGNPDAWHVIWGGEKPMDMAYFTAVLKSTSFPPYDPWLAGGYLNYYYYGFVYVGSITKLLGVVPAVAYNLILPMLYSFTGLGVFSLAYNLVAWRSKKAAGELPRLALMAGGLAMLLAVFLGNLAQIGVIAHAWQLASTLPAEANMLLRILDGGWNLVVGGASAPIYTGDWFWTATRAIAVPDGEVQPITEFPFFTFLYGDLHAHMMSLPLTILALGWAMAIGLADFTRTRPWWETILTWVVGALAVGVLYPTNSWDYPTYLVIALLAITLAKWREHGVHWLAAGQIVYQFAFVFGFSLLAFWPFWANFGTAYGSIKLWETETTGLGNYLAIYGLFLWVFIAFVAYDFKEWAMSWTPELLEMRQTNVFLGVAGFILLIAVIMWLYVVGYAVAPVLLLLAFAGGLAVFSNFTPERRVVHTLIASGLGLTFFVEMFVLEGDIGRMNTVFKFYMQVWILFSVAAGAGLAWIWPSVTAEWGLGRRAIFQTGLALLLFSAFTYPVLATRAKWLIQDDPNNQAVFTLDGMDYMRYVSYGDSGQTVTLDLDQEAIRWIQRNIPGSPVMLEAFSGNPYRSAANRIAMYTGLPAVVGWDWHQRQQRPTTTPLIVSERINDVSVIYSSDNIEATRQLLQKYEVEYIYAGQLEWVYYNPSGLNKFNTMVQEGYLEEVYRNKGVSIYKVVR